MAISDDQLATIESLCEQKQYAEALIQLIKLLTEDPTKHEARLLLAKIFFELVAIGFAAREIAELQVVLPDNDSLKRLAELISPTVIAKVSSNDMTSSKVDSARVVAEEEFDLSDL